jgi:hypothetical protein
MIEASDFVSWRSRPALSASHRRVAPQDRHAIAQCALPIQRAFGSRRRTLGADSYCDSAAGPSSRPSGCCQVHSRDRCRYDPMSNPQDMGRGPRGILQACLRLARRGDHARRTERTRDSSGCCSGRASLSMRGTHAYSCVRDANLRDWLSLSRSIHTTWSSREGGWLSSLRVLYRNRNDRARALYGYVVARFSEQVGVRSVGWIGHTAAA